MHQYDKNDSCTSVLCTKVNLCISRHCSKLYCHSSTTLGSTPVSKGKVTVCWDLFILFFFFRTRASPARMQHNFSHDCRTKEEMEVGRVHNHSCHIHDGSFCAISQLAGIADMHRAPCAYSTSAFDSKLSPATRSGMSSSSSSSFLSSSPFSFCMLW